MSSVSEIRSGFLDYFRRNGHEVVPSSPLVPRNDPTLLFTNSGMVQFKNVFTGAERRPYSRAATSQKCVRAGGKHNDLENVGYTARHHTFFEMLGNFSFGDYFKDVAIELAWKLITDELGLPKERLLATVFAADDDAFGFWRKIAGLPEQRIIRIASSDNFWAMGDTGPCGPCSEIFYDHGPGIPGGPPGSPEAEGDRFIEVWNLVFMQYEQVSPERRIDLPRPSIDTGMGLERIAAVLQGKHDNYQIDLMRALVLASAEASGTEPDGPHRISHRVIADHLRASSFLIADGVLPSNEGRGYVLRRIMRRAMRHAHMLGACEPFIWRLVPALVAQMGQAYPELIRAQALISETLKLEEGRFQQTLGRGLRLLEEETQRLPREGAFPGEAAFKLYDTYGFPIDLTQDILRGQGRTVDRAGFEAAMERQRAAARAAWAGSGEASTGQLWFELKERLGGTDFLGHATDMAEGQVLAVLIDGKAVPEAGEGQEGAIIVNQTPFYGEAGGQVGDTGWFQSTSGSRFQVTDTQRRLGELFVHSGRMEAGRISVGDTVEMRVDSERRTRLRANHSATHLLHQALRRRLGEHVTQKGSLVAPDRLRFDFSHPKPLSAEDIRWIEEEVNARIRANAAVVTQLMTPKDAVDAGALALFGEKYGEEVRVVSMGHEKDDGPAWSTELCGGTHVRRTGDIGLFKIVSESAVAAGVRRIEALTGQGALDYLAERDALLAEMAGTIKASPEELPQRLISLMEERRRLERELMEARRRLAAGAGAATAEPAVKTVAGVAFAGKLVGELPAKELKGLADQMKAKLGSGVVTLVGTSEGKVSIVVGVTDDLVQRISAVDLVRAAAEAVGGKGGGGRPDMAQAGGPDARRASAALAAVEAVLLEKLQVAAQ